MIKVLLINDSYFLRASLATLLRADPNIKAFTAKDYEEAIERLKLNPDVIILSIRMPGISGLDILHQIMQKKPTAIIVTSPEDKLHSKDALQAIKYGAIDVILEPQKTIKGVADIEKQLVELVKATASLKIKRPIVKKLKAISKLPSISEKIIVIGASSGGPPAVEAILTSLPKQFPVPIIVIQHMPAAFTKTFAQRLNKLCKIEVKEAQRGEEIKRGKVLIAPGDYNLEVQKRGSKIVVRLNEEATDIRPSIDMALSSVSKIYGNKTIAIILTGMGSDGAKGVQEVKYNGGTTIAQDKNTSMIFGMPKVVIDEGNADFVLPLNMIGAKMTRLL